MSDNKSGRQQAVCLPYSLLPTNHKDLRTVQFVFGPLATTTWIGLSVQQLYCCRLVAVPGLRNRMNLTGTKTSNAASAVWLITCQHNSRLCKCRIRSSCHGGLASIPWRLSSRTQAAVRLLTTALSGSSCGLAAYTNLPSETCPFEQLTTMISATQRS